MGFNVLEWFAQESWKFDLFLDTKTLIAPIKLKLTSLFLKFCLLLDIFFYGRVEGLKYNSPNGIQCPGMVCARIIEI